MWDDEVWLKIFCSIISNTMVDIKSASDRADEAYREYLKRWSDND